MPKLSGIFVDLPEIDKIPISDIHQWVKTRGQIQSLEDFIGNRVLYPQTVAMTVADLEVDLAILAESVRRNPEIVYDKVSKKLNITESMAMRFPPLQKLIMVLSRVIKFETMVTPIVVVGQKTSKLVGSLVAPPQDALKVQTSMTVEGKDFSPKLGSVSVIHSQNKNINIQIGNLGGIVASCGQLGVLVDLRSTG